MKLKRLKKHLGKEVKSAVPPECSAAPSHASWSSFFSWRNGSFCHSRVSAGWEDGPPLQPVCAAGSLYVWIFFLASLSSACCGPHSFPACTQGQNQDLPEDHSDAGLGGPSVLATPLPFRSQGEKAGEEFSIKSHFPSPPMDSKVLLYSKLWMLL